MRERRNKVIESKELRWFFLSTSSSNVGKANEIIIFLERVFMEQNKQSE